MVKTIKLIILLLLFTCKLFSQNSDDSYVYQYKLRHPGTPSYYYVTDADSTEINHESNLIIKLADSDGDMTTPGIIDVRFTQNTGDTIKIVTLSPASVKLNAGGYNFIAKCGLQTIKGHINISKGFKKELVLVHGIYHELNPIIIESKKKLSPKEINEIIEGYFKEKPSKLVKDETCRVLLEL